MKGKIANVFSHWYILLSFLTVGFFVPFAFFYMAAKAKKAIFLYKGIFNLVVLLSIGIIYILVARLNGFVVTLLVLYIINALYSIFTAQADYPANDSSGSFSENNDVQNDFRDNDTDISRQIIKFIADLQYYKQRIKQDYVHGNIGKLLDLFLFIKNNDVNKAALFEARYGGTITDLLSYYSKLESVQTNDSKITDARLQIEEVLDTSVKAFEQDFSGLLSSDLLQIEAQSEALLQTLQNNKLINGE